MKDSEPVALVKSKQTLAVEALNAFVVGSVNWSPKWFIEADLSTGFNQVSPRNRLLDKLVGLRSIVLDNLLLGGGDCLSVNDGPKTNFFCEQSFIDLIRFNISINRNIWNNRHLHAHADHVQRGGDRRDQQVVKQHVVVAH